MVSIVPPVSLLSHAVVRFAALNVLAVNAIINASPVQHIAVANRISPIVCLYEIVAHVLSSTGITTAVRAQGARNPEVDESHASFSSSTLPMQHAPVALLPSLFRSLFLLAGAGAAVLLITGPGYMPWTRVFAAIYVSHIVLTTWLPPQPQLRQSQSTQGAAQSLTPTWVVFAVTGHLLVCGLVLSPRNGSHWVVLVIGLALVGLFSWLLSMNDSLVNQDQRSAGSGPMNTFTAIVIGISTHQLPVIMSFFALWAASDKYEVDAKSAAAYICVFDMAILGMLITLAPSWPHNVCQTTAFVACTWFIGMIAYNMSISD